MDMRFALRWPIGAALSFALAMTAPGQVSAAGWPTATPAEAGFSAKLGDRLDAALAGSEYEGVHAVVLVRGGKLIYERYLTGDDEIWGRRKHGVVFGPGSLHDVRSITKSVVGLLYGIALSEGRVPRLDAPMLDAFPEYADLAKDPERRAIFVGHALSMTMGLEWDATSRPYSDPMNSEIAMNRAPDSIRYALERPVIAAPGQKWTYNGGATELAAAMIARGAGNGLIDYAREKLFAPLGIEKFEWITDYYDRPHAASALRLKPRDTAKIGQLVLQSGTWSGDRIAPADWIAASIEPHAEAVDGCRYGYHWWLCKTGGGLDVVEAAGWGGQELLILPSLDIVFVVNAGLYGDPDAWKRAFGLLEGVVIPAIEAR